MSFLDHHYSWDQGIYPYLCAFTLKYCGFADCYMYLQALCLPIWLATLLFFMLVLDAFPKSHLAAGQDMSNGFWHFMT